MKYELTVILDDGSKENSETLAEIEKVIESVKGKIVQKDDWGLKHFAYPIKKKESGHYYFYSLEIKPKSTKPLDDKLRLMNQILRYLTVKAG